MTTSSMPEPRRERSQMSSARSPKADIQRWHKGKAGGMERDTLAAEEPLEIRVRGRSVAVTMRTPGQDDELAAGFLLTEGIIRRPADVREIAPCRTTDRTSFGNIVNVFLAPSVKPDFERLTRHVFASSSCGVCGKASIDAVRQQFPAVTSGARVSARTLARLPEKLRQAQAVFAATGGLHAAGIFSRRGRLLVAREDVGRHNAVDKVIGHALLAGLLPLSEHVLLVSGRASFEIVQKALAAGIPVIAAISAPSSLAVEFAKESGQTLVGFLRGETMNVYAHAERLS
jgi:FdhD protein